MTAINVFRRRINERRARLHVANHIRSAGGVGAKALRRAVRTLIEVCGQMNDGVVFLPPFDRLFVANVESGTSRKIVGGEILPDKRAEIATATGNQNLHLVSARSEEH